MKKYQHYIDVRERFYQLHVATAVEALMLSIYVNYHSNIHIDTELQVINYFLRCIKCR